MTGKTWSRYIWENLEQIYKGLALEFSAEAYQSDNFYWRQGRKFLLLSTVADTILSLVNKQLLAVRFEKDSLPGSALSYVWRGWFAMTDAGKALWESDAECYCPEPNS